MNNDDQKTSVGGEFNVSGSFPLSWRYWLSSRDDAGDYVSEFYRWRMREEYRRDKENRARNDDSRRLNDEHRRDLEQRMAAIHRGGRAGVGRTPVEFNIFRELGL